MEEVAKKMREYFEKEGVTQVDIAKELQVSAAYINAIMHGRRGIGKKQAEKISNRFGLSKSWLLTGEGPMLRESQVVVGDDNTATQNNGDNNVTHNVTNNYAAPEGPDVKTKQEMTDMSDRMDALEDASPASSAVGAPTANPSTAGSVYMVPLLPVTAQGGSLNDFVASVELSNCELIISPIRGVDFGVKVAGDSMAPEYPNGCIALIKRINERAFIEWGRTYVLDTCNGVVIKQLIPGKTEGSLTCVSLNKNQETYAPFQVELSDVYGIYLVLMSLAMK